MSAVPGHRRKISLNDSWSNGDGSGIDQVDTSRHSAQDADILGDPSDHQIHHTIQAISFHNYKIWIVRNHMHNRRQNFPNEEAGKWVPKCRWLRRQYFKYCENLIQREEWEVQPRKATVERPQLLNKIQIDRYYYRVLSNEARWA